MSDLTSDQLAELLRSPSFLEKLKEFLKPYLDKLQTDTSNLKTIATEIENIKASINDNHELLITKLGVLEVILDKVRNNTTQ